MNKNVIIIGASSGIGRELAKIFSSSGYTVGITARRVDLLSEAAKEFPGVSFVKYMDISKPDEAVSILEGLIVEMGGVDIIVISAGTGFLNPDLDWEKEKMTIDINVTGFTAMADAAVKIFLRQGHGHLAGISSLAALRGDSYAPAYGASKAFVSNYLEALRFKIIKKKLPITITDIQPGFIDTAMAQGEGLFWVAPAKKAARQIYDAIKKKKKRAYITRRWQLIAWLLRVLPDWALTKFV